MAISRRNVTSDLRIASLAEKVEDKHVEYCKRFDKIDAVTSRLDSCIDEVRGSVIRIVGDVAGLKSSNDRWSKAIIGVLVALAVAAVSTHFGFK